MKRALIPFAMIAIIGILTMIVISSVGMNQEQAIESEEEGGGEEQTASANPEEMFQNSCASCHGGDLSGGVGPNLQGIGDRLSVDEIVSVIENGKGQMPAGLYTGEEAQQVAEWLVEQ
ncbi:cytochrome c550 [Salimicrobium flavidum]|uniref:Cytochrome c550 n=1 Tax=Salimicrobium flavidum TaxID=570947 RepID=A0A1N7IIB7_9BACI|nr:cytochrome c [Salimicrobium flavidum]SIS36844.1 cytochrome c550 [Salimicrobium flavidum]